ncbi:NB-ARC domain-containing protein [Kitasatospora sp. NPDC059327]|uniref:NB-ARC domain-containing protein n=1 Tax=Kitasatospora sp. NPDC059327 TaxID=3346803 RepID=UPI0036AF2BEC
MLPGARTCAVLVTSRVWPTGLPGAHHLHLDAMEPAEALDLLATVAGRARTEAEPEAATAIVTACGLLPLAVRVAGSRLAADPAQSLAGLASALADERTRLAELTHHHTSVEPVLALSYARLDNERAGALRQLALPDTPVLGLGPAATLLDRAREAGERCAELTGGEASISSSVGSYYLARILHLCGDLARALERAEGALARFRSFGVPAFHAATGGLIARIHHSAGRQIIIWDYTTGSRALSTSFPCRSGQYSYTYTLTNPTPGHDYKAEARFYWQPGSGYDYQLSPDLWY